MMSTQSLIQLDDTINVRRHDWGMPNPRTSIPPPEANDHPLEVGIDSAGGIPSICPWKSANATDDLCSI